MAKMYYDKNCNSELLRSKKLAVIGYGSQGHAHALNLHESGFDVVVALTPLSKSRALAEADGLKVMNVDEATKACDIIMMLTPDEIQASLYEEQIKPYLASGKALVFAHGFNIHYNQIVPPSDVDVFMVAPKGPGHTVRSQFLDGKGVPCLIAVHQDASGQAKELALAWACGIGGGRAGILETTFQEETETDLFGEQAVLCGGVVELMKAGFDTLVEAGYQPESAYFECVHEMKLIIDLVASRGISGMRDSISTTAEYGDYVTGKRIITDKTREAMREVLGEVQDGTFAKEWILENKVGYPKFYAMRRKQKEHMTEKVGDELRKMMK